MTEVATEAVAPVHTARVEVQVARVVRATGIKWTTPVVAERTRIVQVWTVAATRRRQEDTITVGFTSY